MDAIKIAQAHTAASDLAIHHSLMMHIASLFFTPEHRRAAHAVYAFFRTADDLVDDGCVSLDQFRAWQQQVRRPIEEQTDPYIIAWADICARYNIPLAYEQAILNGLELDLACHTYETLDELKQYCYSVAVVPLLLAMHIVGFRPGVTLEQARPYIENIGMAVQLTDILRDLDEDVTKGRIYIPRAELAGFGLTFEDIKARCYDERFKNFMQHFVNIARDHYRAGWPILDLFSGSFRLAGGCGILMNRMILDEIERCRFNVYPGIKIPALKRFWLLANKWPSIYWTQSADVYFL